VEAKEASTPSPSWTFNDIFLHWTKEAKQIFLFSSRNFEGIKRLDQIIDQRSEIGIGNVHSGVCRFHIAAPVYARSSGCHADLVNEMAFQLRYIRRGKAAIDAAVGCHIRDELVNHR